MNFDGNLVPVCISDDLPPDLSENECFATGWGHTQVNGTDSTILQEALMPIVNSSYCFAKYSFKFDVNTQICAGGTPTGGLGTCHGDSGGPLQCKMPDGRWYQVGVVSWGVSCAKPNLPDVYTKVTAFYDWIQDIIDNN